MVLHGLISDLCFFFVRQGLDKQVPEIKIFSFYTFYNANCFIFAFCVCVFFPIWFMVWFSYSKPLCREQTFISVCRVCHPLPAWEAEREHGVML